LNVNQLSRDIIAHGSGYNQDVLWGLYLQVTR